MGIRRRKAVVSEEPRLDRRHRAEHPHRGIREFLARPGLRVRHAPGVEIDEHRDALGGALRERLQLP
jgi:hypothetical protein